MCFHTLIIPNSFKVTMQFMISQLCYFSLPRFQPNLAMQCNAIHFVSFRGRRIGACDVSRSKILKSSIQSTQLPTVHKIQHFRKCIYILTVPGLVPSVHFTLLYTTLNLKACKINNASKKFVTFLRGWDEGIPEKRPYDVSRGQNRYATLS